MKVDSRCNAIIILQSLHDGDRETGKHIYNVFKNKLKISFFDIVGKKDCFEVLHHILNKTKQAQEHGKLIKPIIQFDCHGCKEYFEFGDGSKAEFYELTDILCEINLNTGMNLIVIGAACFGIYIQDVMLHLFIEKKEIWRAPFSFAIGFDEEVMESTLQEAMTDFYGFFCNSKKVDLNKASDAINIFTQAKKVGFQVVSSQIIFTQGILVYIKENCSGSILEKRVKNMQLEIMRRNSFDISLCPPKNEIRKFLGGHESLEKWYEENAYYFFGIDRYPENKCLVPPFWDVLFNTYSLENLLKKGK